MSKARLNENKEARSKEQKINKSVEGGREEALKRGGEGELFVFLRWAL